jgi:RNA polymerase sigma factor (sigma-70 family)
MRDIHGAIDAVWRIESAKLIASLTRVVRDVGLAEELSQDALVIALEQWPRDGIPDNPAAWLMSTAKHRAIDRVRRDVNLDRKYQEIGRDLEVGESMQDDLFAQSVEGDVNDNLLRLMFICCHPVLSPEARVALTLRLLGGLTTVEIARAFLTPEPTIAQRIVRAKRTLSEARVPFEQPEPAAREERLGSVLEVLYLIYNEGYTATAGDDWLRPELCNEALRLARILAGLAPNDSETFGLLALMELQSSRIRARTTASGEPVTLLEQNRALWDRLQIARGLAAFKKAVALGGVNQPYALQAGIASCHAHALTADATDWPRIVTLYDALVEITGSPVVELNRAVAVLMAFGPDAALPLLDALEAVPAMQRYHHLANVRGDVLSKLGRHAEARAQFERAAALTANAREHSVLLKRAHAAHARAGGDR